MSQLFRVYNYHSMIWGRVEERGHVTRNFCILTSGGPPRNIVPCLPTIILSSAIAGTYAPPAVQDPMTTAIYQRIKKAQVNALKIAKAQDYMYFNT